MKTESEAISPAALSGEVRSVSEIVSDLRAAFRTVDFDRAEEAMVARETALRREIARREQEKQEITELRELESLEMADLRAKLERGAESAALEAAEKLLEEKENEVSELKRKLREAEAEAERWKRSYAEMDARLATVEADTVGLLMTSHSPAPRQSASKCSDPAGGNASPRNAGYTNNPYHTSSPSRRTVRCVNFSDIEDTNANLKEQLSSISQLQRLLEEPLLNVPNPTPTHVVSSSSLRPSTPSFAAQSDVDEDAQHLEEVEPTVPFSSRSKRKKSTAGVWQFFNHVYQDLDDGTTLQWAFCKTCGKKFNASSSLGTLSLKNHGARCDSTHASLAQNPTTLGHQISDEKCTTKQPILIIDSDDDSALEGSLSRRDSHPKVLKRKLSSALNLSSDKNDEKDTMNQGILNGNTGPAQKEPVAKSVALPAENKTEASPTANGTETPPSATPNQPPEVMGQCSENTSSVAEKSSLANRSNSFWDRFGEIKFKPTDDSSSSSSSISESDSNS